jgi:hypothetical protein
MEEIAREVLQRLMGSIVEHHDDGSSSAMYDLAIHGDAGREAAEVVADMDEAKRERMVAGARLSPVLTDSGLEHAWSVTVANRARIKTVKRQLVATLKELERAGVSSTDRFGEETEFSLLLEAAHLTSARVEGGGPPGRVYVFAGVSEVGNPLPVDGLSGYVTAVLAVHDDVRQKLAASSTERTHAVILVTTDRSDVLWALGDDETALPKDDPDVPMEISDVWLLAMWPGDRVLRWARGTGWTHAGFMPDDM